MIFQIFFPPYPQFSCNKQKIPTYTFVNFTYIYKCADFFHPTLLIGHIRYLEPQSRALRILFLCGHFLHPLKLCIFVRTFYVVALKNTNFGSTYKSIMLKVTKTQWSQIIFWFVFVFSCTIWYIFTISAKTMY